jgi:2-polyprenyl-6-hydroxyphenyl methylase/3-demethylubiquinone-9 3-methyltransferase
MPFDSNQWWNERGPFRLLHECLPLRMALILNTLSQDHQATERPLRGCRVVDVGCGAGLTSEPLARLGAHVVGIDPEPQAIRCAINHLNQCQDVSLNVSYVCQDPFTWLCPNPVDLIVVFEVLEHVEKPFQLLEKMLSWLRPGGVIIGSTINRTKASSVFAIDWAENILGLVPPGTHRSDLFLTPEEITSELAQQGCDRIHRQGYIYIPTIGWRYSAFSGINYFFSARKPPLCHP